MYQHFREVTSLEKKELIYRGEAFTKSDFLDSIALDLPKGAWSLQLDHSNTLVIYIYRYIYIGSDQELPMARVCCLSSMLNE